MGLQHDTTLDFPSALNREISLKNIHTASKTPCLAMNERAPKELNLLLVWF